MAEDFEFEKIPVQSGDQLPLIPSVEVVDNPQLHKWLMDITNWARRLNVLMKIGSGDVVGDGGGGGIHGFDFPDLPTDKGVYWLKLTITGPNPGDVSFEWGETVEGCSDCGS